MLFLPRTRTQQIMKTTKKNKVVSRHEKIELAIETMRQATRQFKETGYGLSTEDIGPLYVAYSDEDEALYVSARNLEDGWDLSFKDLAKQLIEGLTNNGDDYDEIADHSMSLVSSLRNVANQIERGVKKFIDDEGMS